MESQSTMPVRPATGQIRPGTRRLLTRQSHRPRAVPFSPDFRRSFEKYAREREPGVIDYEGLELDGWMDIEEPLCKPNEAVGCGGLSASQGFFRREGDRQIRLLDRHRRHDEDGAADGGADDQERDFRPGVGMLPTKGRMQPPRGVPRRAGQGTGHAGLSLGRN